MQWFMFWHDRWLEGDIRKDYTNDERSMFVDLLCLASRYGFRDGAIRTAIGKPLSRQRICDLTNQPMELLDRTISKGQAAINNGDNFSRIVVWDDGTIYIPKFKEMNKSKKEKAQYGGSNVSDDEKDTMIINRILARNPKARSAIESNIKAKLNEDAIRDSKQAAVDEQQREIGALYDRASKGGVKC
jgi:hypothetical protein